MPTTVVISIGSRASDSVTVNTVTSTTVSGYANAWSVVLSATVPSTTKIGDKLTTSARDYLITNISGSTLTVVGDPFTTTAAPSTGSGATTRSFPSLTTWASGAPASLVTKDWIWKGEVYKEGAGTNGEWTSTADSSFAATTDATRYFFLTAATGQSFKDNAGKLTNALRYNPANGVAIAFGNNQFLLNTNAGAAILYVNGLQFSGGTYNTRTVNSSSGQTYLSDCILKNGAIRGAVSCVNVLAFQDYTSSFWLTPGYVSGQYFRNCTIYGNNTSSAFATVSSDASFVLKNCAIFGYTAVAATTSSFTSGSCSNNATNLASVGFGSSNVVNLTASNQFTSLTGGSEDFRIIAGSGFINAGTRDQTYTNDLDIVGTTRSLTTPTIGAWEYPTTALSTLVVQSSPGTSALNGTAPDPTNVPGLNWFATTASFARLAGGGITNGGAGLNTLSYLLPTSLHKVSIGTTSSLANGNQYVTLLCNGSANNVNFFSGSGYYLYIRGGGIGPTAIIRVVGGVNTTVASFGPNTTGVIDSAFLDCSVSGTVSGSVTIGGTTYTGSYTDPSPLTGSYAGLNFGDQGGGTVTVASVTLSANTVTYTYSRPSSDVTTQWTPSTAGPHYALINETTYNDANYIYATAAAQTDEVGLQAMTAPQAGTNVLVNYRVQGITGGGSVTVSLYCGATLVKTDTTRTANNTSPAYYTMTVTPGDYSVVTNWSDMRLRFVSA